MDPISTAIIAAVASGVTKEIAASAYLALKNLLLRKFGPESKVVQAVKDVEEDPESQSYKTVLQEQILKAKADEDAELLEVAQVLLEKIKAEPSGSQSSQQAIGTNIAQASGGGVASVNVNKPGK